MKKYLVAILFSLAAVAAHAQSVTSLPQVINTLAVTDFGNGPLKFRVMQGDAYVFTSQGSGTGSTSGPATSLTLTAVPSTPPCIGCGVSGTGVIPGTVVTAYDGVTSLTLSVSATVPAATSVSWGAACPASIGSARYVTTAASADFLPLYTWARVCGASPGGPADAILTLPFADSGLVALPHGQIFIGSLAGVAVAQSMSGDCTITDAGAVTCTKTNGVAFGPFATSTDAKNNIANFNSGTGASSTTFWRGDGTWSAVPTRIRLAAATNFYVDPLGTDVAGCGVASGAAACRQPQYLANILLSQYDFAGQSVTINLANGTYNAIQINGPWVGATAVPQAYSNVAFVGATQAGAIIDGTSVGQGYCIQANEYSSFRVSTLTVQNCIVGLSAPNQHSELYFDHISWSSMPAGSIGVYASRFGYIEMTGGGNIINSIGAYWLQATHQGNFRASALNTGATAVTLVGSLTCVNGQFAYASSQGDITFTQYSAAPFVGPAATCVQWGADSSGLFQVLNVSTGKGMTAPGFFPGGTAGVCVGDCNIDQAAHAGTTVNTCGTGPSISGTDYSGHVVEGTSATSCIVVFNSPVGVVPYNCQITWTTAAPASVTYAQNGNQFVLSHSSASNAAFNYYCKGF